MHQNPVAMTQTRMLTFLWHSICRMGAKLRDLETHYLPNKFAMANILGSPAAILISALNCTMVHSESNIHGRSQTDLLSKPEFI